ncbi:unnamed protein product [Protopolystoma xenopodis]|uniref:Uncharacterized protein n=1 Tax=Protopolystoma xenopodis TaxID=117903 RepID=A0A448X8H9_9PLAT|nr:unnamed protein product [Protopolystoma xenopodis]
MLTGRMQLNSRLLNCLVAFYAGCRMVWRTTPATIADTSARTRVHVHADWLCDDSHLRAGSKSTTVSDPARTHRHGSPSFLVENR